MLLPFFSFCQKYINQSRNLVIQDIKKYKHGAAKPVISETDSTITILVKTSSLPADFIYGFDKAGKCISEKVIARCDSCINKKLQSALKIGKYGWKKINENQYVSKFEEKMMIELPVESNEYYYTILRMDWTKTLYNILISGK